MTSQRSYVWPVVCSIIAILLLIVALPPSSKQWAPGFLRNADFHFGLDLVGGTQLDFRISESEMEKQVADLNQKIEELEDQAGSQDRINLLRQQLYNIEEQHRNIVEAIRTVLERRINALGVSEAVITPSYIGDEKHLLVECPGVVDTQQCIDTIGKTIQLEFKEEHTEPTEEYKEEVRARVQVAVDRMSDTTDSLSVVGEDMSSELGVLYSQEQNLFLDDLPEGLEDVWYKTPGSGVLKREGSISVPTSDGSEQSIDGVFLVEILRARTQTGRTVNEAPKAFEIIASQKVNVDYKYHKELALDDNVDTALASQLKSIAPGELTSVTLADGSARVVFLRLFVPGIEEMEVSHILISHKEANLGTEETPTRSRKEALELAKQIKQQLDEGGEFHELAKNYSDGISRDQGGSLGVVSRGMMAPTFEQSAFSLPEGSISDPVETQFGYHIIRSDKAPSVLPDTANFDELTIRGENPPDRATEFFAKLKQGNITRQEEMITMRSLFFSLLPTGWKDTTLDGKHFRSATVTLDPVTNIPVVQIMFDEEGGRIFQELTKNNIGKRIAIFVGGELVSAPTVQSEIAGGIAVITGSNSFEEARLLAQDLNTGAIPAPIYLSGQRTVEATLGAMALQTSLKAALIGLIILMLYMIVMYRVLGVLADLALSLYAFMFFALLKLPLFLFSSQHIVLTLAGMAGIILSIGMAVDANVLIFERMKEELRKGKLLKTAAETGFQRAWPSIRDGNVSTFITCAILFIIGTSIVRGFAITLGIGVLLSMFSAIVITRWLIKHIAYTPLASNMAAFGIKRPAPENE